MATRIAFYLAIGEEWAREAIMSAYTLKEHMPDLPVLLYTDSDIKPGLFDAVIKVPSLNTDQRLEAAYCRIPLMKEFFYNDLVLRLDTDTFILDDLSPVFDLLEHFDIVVAHASTHFTIPLDDVPDSFPEYHAGMIACRRSQKMDDFIDDWAAKYWELVEWAEGEGRNRLPPRICPYHADQAAMRWALYYSDLRIATLTPEWDCCPYAGFAQGKIRLIHDRGARLKRARSLNRELGSRVYVDGEIVGIGE
jgi:hypothetical protein